MFDEDDINGEGQTQKMNIDREPRYYAWISFHNGYYECQGRYTQGSGNDAYKESNLRGIKNEGFNAIYAEPILWYSTA